jgi:ribonuclease HI
VHVDGAARNNPGPAAFGYVICDAGGGRIEARGEYLGETTNNVAEYRGMVAAARRAAELGAARVTFHVDSQLLQRQVTGRYRVKAAHLKPLVADLLAALRRIPDWAVVHVPRERNRAADRLANRALDARGTVS